MMDSNSFANVDNEPTDEMLHLIMKEVAEDAKRKSEISEKEMKEKILKETNEAFRKYHSVA